MEDALVHTSEYKLMLLTTSVLILVVMEDALVLLGIKSHRPPIEGGLNPCCNGRCTRTCRGKRRKRTKN